VGIEVALSGPVAGSRAAQRGGIRLEAKRETPISANLSVPKINERLPINSEYAGRIYPSDKLPSVIKSIYPDGVPFNQNGFPEFPVKVEIKLPIDKHTGSRLDHFKIANEALLVMEKENLGYLLSRGLNQQQISHIMKNPPSATSPPGLTWHHNEKPG